jgi:hypothetical protein
MKGLFFASLLASLQAMTLARAYEADIHYSTTYVLARAAGWSQADARIIASANQGVDENHDTVAALEMDTTPTSSLHQAEKNLRFHCFSRTRGQAGQISADVLEVMSGHFADVADRHDDPRMNARRLIALGVALHCQQDAYAHVDFGGSCGAYAGSCYGHTHHNFLDSLVFSLLKKHHHNPDHPGVSGDRLLEALRGTASELTGRRPKNSSRSIPTAKLVALSDQLRGSGLELPDDVRRDCNRYIAGKWLFDFLHSGSGTHDSTDTPEKLSPEIARSCGHAALASATVASIPAPRFPRLDAHAAPDLVRADGSYLLVRDAGFEASPRRPNYHAQQVRLQLSHWSQLLALPGISRVVRLSAQSVEAPAAIEDSLQRPASILRPGLRRRHVL